MPLPDKPVPLGCVIAFFGLVLLLGAAFAFHASYVAYHARPPQIDKGRALIRMGVGIVVLSIFPMVLGAKRFTSRMFMKEEDRNRMGNSWKD